MIEHTVARDVRSDAVRRRLGAVAAPIGTLAVAGACWVVSLRQMSGMDMGPATELGALASFLGLWAPMMAAMMLPAALPAVARFTKDNPRMTTGVVFVATYVAVWTAVGLAVFALYRAHGEVAAGALTVAAGLYELTPVKRECRRRCRERLRSGLEFGTYCVGSSVGLMVALLALGVMSVTWMAVIAALVFIQKALRPRVALDATVALGLVALGALVALAPGAVPGLAIPM
jgi:predicted metal-binding membrane protein